MNRRRLLQTAAAAIPFLPAVPSLRLVSSLAAASDRPVSRVRPADGEWPSQESWNLLNRQVGGRLEEIESPLIGCIGKPPDTACARIFENVKNPYYLGDHPALTQTLGWVDAWTSRPSVYAVAARTTDDVVAAVNFARDNDLRLVINGGGHSYQGTSSAPDSLLIWTRGMNAVTVHDAFIATGCAEQEPQPAVTVAAGAIWAHVYDAVTTEAGRYVQGGGCLTVGVAGLIQSGGFGSFSKAYGTAASNLLEAEIVTADGNVRIANACNNADLFWGLKGGGGGSLGVVTRLTLRTHDLPEFFGGVFATVRARSDGAFRRLIAKIVEFYREALFNPRWGEQIAFRPDNVLSIAMVFQGLDRRQAEATWQPFLAWLAASPQDFSLDSAPTVIALPALRFWDPEFLKQQGGLVLADERPGAPAGNIFWAGNLEETGQVLHGYQSMWLPSELLDDRSDQLADALFAASRHWSLSLHVNKGLAGAPPPVIDAARDSATNPKMLDAFALAISGAEGPPAYPGIPDREPDVSMARRHARAIERAMAQMRELVPNAGSYVAESNFFEEAWQESFWARTM